ncbi:Murein DD-endopeptidase MepM and murein hydrolase activator NlpD, contain LysM domain [Leeuwenhoekiella marinoflava DSM 3653]|uniref:Murein DD-endopeptidase MepM/ murein hydrolase activator NlpD n=2 Tax=Leeuwenhoekiella marinoflava TaxID=988 RepID=A0A4Q0PR95_9FLAO|nr:murein DD-endopeptidase MepM/ murein hydrolase activator NlpD [Leeuwenhoekiella marinoflava]SHE40647.1 Murein DD-endopeptidase MepM and murein hydrolase activator NlpD, contain LysM domain [Leeuwenhoekiella marinoflava DSM 3653]
MLAVLTLMSCADDKKIEQKPEVIEVKKPLNKRFGYVLDDYEVISDTVQSGDSFGQILFENGIDYGTIQQITDTVQATFDTRKIVVGKPYTLLKSKDSANQARVFIYEQNKIDYVVLDFADEVVKAAAKKRPVTVKERVVSGVINSNLSSTFDDIGVNILVAYKMADIYAWTIDFFRLQQGDKFKVVYTEKFINDTIPAGFGEIKASWFEHKGKPVYAFAYQNDSVNDGIRDFYDQHADNLRRAFLKSPLKFGRISSRYNLKRRIAYYGNRIRPHKGTDFAAPVGTPIMATSDGTVIASEYRGGNGNYVKVRHNKTYDTQYLHMSKRAVSRGDYVRQGEVIGYIGMTGNTSGPHVCYRFWKNGKQVNPFAIDLPTSEPLAEELQPQYFEFIAPLRAQLDAITFQKST